VYRFEFSILYIFSGFLCCGSKGELGMGLVKGAGVRGC